MIEFKPFSIADKALITSYTLNSGRRNCDLSFSNLCSWQFLYHTEYSLLNGFLLMKFQAEGKTVYMMPIGEGDLEDTIEQMIEYSKSYSHQFCMLGISSYMKDDLENAMPGRFHFTSDRDYADYIYLRSDLATLKGKKYQSKRNHINRFRNTYPNHRYEPITPDNIAQCIEFEEKWCRANRCDENKSTCNERKALNFAMNHFEELGLMGGILYVDDMMVAFTFGMPINQTEFGVNAEKADANIDGAYTMINYEFANRIPEQYTYINREEDLGVEGLRKAKLSYHPDILLEKYMACLKESPLEMIRW